MTRSDALRNRRRAIESARVVLAERGLDAPLDEIARRAGIGNATLYRHFPARCDLVVAACADALREIVAAGERALAQDDAWIALTDVFAYIGELCADDRALAELLAADAMPTAELDMLRAESIAAIRELSARARAQGALRREFDDEDILLILKASTGLLQCAQGRPDLWRRHLGLLLEGLRSRDRPAQPTHPLR